MVKIQTRRQGAHRGKIIPFEFSKPLDSYLRKQAKREGKTMVQFMEELLLLHKSHKLITQSDAPTNADAGKAGAR